ncbi:hypothetical protein [Streptomyces sp. NPDC001507]|uniref:hypothetical protein n=1 Tax=Streptomyces sp. NPDC001507 TaxID=3364579 RepID=UPI0036D108E6
MDDSLGFESLFEGAKKTAYKAMDDHARGEYDEFALHAGVAIERLAKAVLVKMNPMYIASGKVHIGPQSKVKIYTITASEALTRLQSLGICKYDTDLKMLIEQRNGTVHATGGDESKTQIPTFAKVITAMLKHLGIPDYDFWGRWTSAVDVAVSRQRNEIQRDVELRMKQARHLFDDRFKGLPEKAKEQVLKEYVEPVNVPFYSARADGAEDDVLALALFVTTTCPACGGQARLKLRPVSTTQTGAQLAPESLACGLCNLVLDGPDQIAASGADVEKAQLPAGVAFTWGPTLAFTPKISQVHSG